ncbi:hypothetical protein [Paenibacillus sp. SAFN-117]|uniref:hypothetical protein n=1 Tax=Paenibacillus sp. SAFN-117 TaxID=3436860 RepID=UPI003F8165C4
MNNWTKEEAAKIKEQLDKELSAVQFTDSMKASVLRQAKRTFWEKEVYIPHPFVAAVVGVMVLAAVLIFNPVSRDQQPEAPAGPKLVVLNSGVFYEEQLQEGGDRP